MAEGYPSGVSDEEWALYAPYRALMKEDAPQRVYALRAVFNAVRYLVRSGCVRGAAGPTDGGDPGQTHGAIDRKERSARRLRWSKAPR